MVLGVGDGSGGKMLSIRRSNIPVKLSSEDLFDDTSDLSFSKILFDLFLEKLAIFGSYAFSSSLSFILLESTNSPIKLPYLTFSF